MNATTMDPKAIYETWEKAATAWFDAWSKSPAYLSAMGKTLEAQLGAKAGIDKAMESWFEMWKIPTAQTVESLGDRISVLEERMAAVESKGTRS